MSALPGWQVPPTHASAGPHRYWQLPPTQSSHASGLQRLWQTPPTQRWQGPQLSLQPCAVQVWQIGSQNDWQEPDWQLRHAPRSQASKHSPLMQVSHEAQRLTQTPPAAQVWHWVASQVLWQTPPAQVWQRPGSHAAQVPLTQVWQEPQVVWHVPLTHVSHGPHRLRQAPPMQS